MAFRHPVIMIIAREEEAIRGKDGGFSALVTAAVSLALQDPEEEKKENRGDFS